MRAKLKTYGQRLYLKLINIDKGAWLALIIGMIAATSFLVNPGLPAATDAELHVFRTAELGYSLRAGNLYPRWAPDFYHGHGYPIFNYYAPLTYHLANWVTFLQPELAEAGTKVLFIVAHVIGSMGAYRLGKLYGKQSGGLLAAAAFSFSPYNFLVNPHIRGDIPEFFALALLPWVFLSWEKLWGDNAKHAFANAVLTALATLLSHNLTGLTAMAALFVFCVWQWLVLKRQTRFGWALLAGVLVAGLSAYFWLPFLLEQKFVQLSGVAGEGHYDFHNHFVSLRELLSSIPIQDWSDTTIRAPMSVGMMFLCLASLGFIFAILKRLKDKPKTGESYFSRLSFYALMAALCFLLTTSMSQWLWETIPGLSFYQFPWRFLGPLSVFLIPLTAAIATHLPLPKVSIVHRNTIISAAMLFLLMFALPGFYIQPWESGFANITRQTIIDAELEGRWRGTTSTNDFVPTTVDLIPGPQESLLQSYKTPPIDRVNRYTVPENASVEILEDAPWRNRFAVETPEKFLLRLYLFYFPGWKAYVDGVETPIEIAHPEGFITLSVPPGTHEVLLSFEDTPPRQWGWYIAGVACLCFAGAVWVWMRSFDNRDAHQKSDTNSHNNSIMDWMAVVIIATLVIKFLILDGLVGGLRYISLPGEVRVAQRQQEADFGAEIALLAYDLSVHTLKAGGPLEVTLYWSAQRPMTETYQSFVHFTAEDNYVWEQSDHLNPAGFPTNLWPTDRYVRDKHQLTLPVDLPPGEYQLSVGLYTLSDNQRLTIISSEPGLQTDNLILSQPITVRP